MKKTMVIETLATFEEEFDTEALIERLLFIEKVEKGLEDKKNGRVTDFESVKKNFIDKWAK